MKSSSGLPGAERIASDASAARMKVISVISTKGGVGKTTVAANLGGFLADAGLHVVLVDLDIQPTLSSYYRLTQQAPGGAYELLALNEQRAERVVSYTDVSRLEVIVSNDPRGQLSPLLLQAPDGRLRLRHLLPIFERDYDVMLIDTQGARSVLLEMALLASSRALSPVIPEILAAAELRRGTVSLIEHVEPMRYWGIEPPHLDLLVNRTPAVSTTARIVQSTLRDVFRDTPNVSILETTVPALEAYQRAAVSRAPVHRTEPRKPRHRRSPSALHTMQALSSELFPEWASRFNQLAGTR